MSGDEAEPSGVAWLLIERGWAVEAADGARVGVVEDVVGDRGRDIFDGLAVAPSLWGRSRYVPSEQVGAITRGRVRLALDGAAFERLGPGGPAARGAGHRLWARIVASARGR